MFQERKASISQKEHISTHSTKDYVRTSDPKKLQLIDLVIHEKYSMKLASQLVGVKLSTVKYIVKAYKTDKQEFMSKLKPKKDKLPKQKQCQLPETESDPKKIVRLEVKEQQPEVKNQQNQEKFAQQLHQEKNQNQFQNHIEFQRIYELAQYWNLFYGWNNNWFIGSYPN